MLKSVFKAAVVMLLMAAVKCKVHAQMLRISDYYYLLSCDSAGFVQTAKAIGLNVQYEEQTRCVAIVTNPITITKPLYFPTGVLETRLTIETYDKRDFDYLFKYISPVRGFDNLYHDAIYHYLVLDWNLPNDTRKLYRFVVMTGNITADLKPGSDFYTLYKLGKGTKKRTKHIATIAVPIQYFLSSKGLR
jgi:hypothetical protein